jgi:hypothetical protein
VGQLVAFIDGLDERPESLVHFLAFCCLEVDQAEEIAVLCGQLEQEGKKPDKGWPVRPNPFGCAHALGIWACKDNM